MSLLHTQSTSTHLPNPSSSTHDSTRARFSALKPIGIHSHSLPEASPRAAVPLQTDLACSARNPPQITSSLKHAGKETASCSYELSSGHLHARNMSRCVGMEVGSACSSRIRSLVMTQLTSMIHTGALATKRQRTLPRTCSTWRRQAGCWSAELPAGGLMLIPSGPTRKVSPCMDLSRSAHCCSEYCMHTHTHTHRHTHTNTTRYVQVHDAYFASLCRLRLINVAYTSIREAAWSVGPRSKHRLTMSESARTKRMTIS